MNTLELLARAFASRHDDPVDDDGTAARILDAAQRQVELFGIQRTTMEDIARRSGMSRVTVYRHFPNKEKLVEAVVLREVQRFLTALGEHVDGFATDDERIVEGFVFTVRELRQHSLVRRLLEGEPELFLPQLTTEAGPILAFARESIVDYVKRRGDLVPRGMRDEDLAIAAEIGVRLTLSLVLTPESAIDLTDSDRLRALARRYVVPFIDADVLALVKAKGRRPR